MQDFWAVIPAGGAGTRLWPLSRQGSPKFLHDLTGSGRSLLQDTVHRLAPLCGDRVRVVTGADHAPAVRDQTPGLPDGALLVEPAPRDSMPAIGLAAALLERTHPDAVIGSFAADHVIGDADAFRACVAEAVTVARTGLLVTIGIEPAHPATGFGYIHVGEPLPVDGAPRARRVRSFVEKPDAPTARAYLASGEYRWNAGMFVARAATLLDLLAAGHPELAADLRDIAADPGLLPQRWPALPRISIDHAVAEPAAAAGRVAVIPGGFDWDDVGDFASLAALLPEADDAPGMKVLGASDLVLARGSTGVVAPASGRTVVALGLEDVVVVDTPDALLVTNRQHAQDVKAIVEELRSSGRADLT